MRKHLFLLLLSALLGLTAGCRSAVPPPPPPLSAFDFTLEKLSPAEQVAFLQKLGYDGMMANTWGAAPADRLRAFTRVPAVASGEFKIRAILWTPKVGDMAQERMAADFLPLAATLRASLWVAPVGNRSQLPETVALLRRTADRCRDAGVGMVLYPHYGHPFEDGFQALDVWGQLGRPEVRLSLHLCHELKAGNLGRWDELVRLSGQRLAFVSVSGADTSHVTRDHDWSRTILPLDEGDLKLAPYVESLRRHGFKGTVFLHTFGIKTAPGEHFARSLAAWKAQ